MGVKISLTMLLLLQIEVVKFFLKFLPNGPHKNAFGIFEILKIEILMSLFRSTWDPMGVQILKR